jgi:hypothetical protein
MNFDAILPFLPLYATLVPLIASIVRHEKERVKICLLLRQICKRLDIECGGGEL